MRLLRMVTGISVVCTIATMSAAQDGTINPGFTAQVDICPSVSVEYDTRDGRIVGARVVTDGGGGVSYVDCRGTDCGRALQEALADAGCI